MICPYCNTNNKPGSNFCMGCGSNWSKVLLLSPLRKKVFRNQWAQSKKFPRKVLIQTGLWTHIFHPHLGLCSTHHPPSRHTPPNCATTSCATTRRICERPQPSRFWAWAISAARVSTGTPASHIPGTSKKKKSNALWIILGVVGGLLVLCVILFFAVIRPIINRTKDIIEGEMPNVMETIISESVEETPEVLPTEAEVPLPTEPAGGSLIGSDTVWEGFPATAEEITAENAYRMEQGMRFGDGYSLAISYSPDGKYLAVATSIGVDIMDPNSGQKVKRLLDDEPVYDLIFAPNGDLLASTYDGIYHFTADSFESISMFAENAINYEMTLSSDGSILASDYYDVALIFKKTGQTYTYSHEIIDGEDYYVIGISPDGTKLASGNSDGELKIWDVDSGNLLKTINAHTDYINQLAWSPDSSLIATASDDDSLAIYNISSGEKVFSNSFDSTNGTAVVFSADGTKLIANGDYSEIAVWDINAGSLLKTFTWGDTYFTNLELNTANTSIFARNDYGQLILWDYETNQQTELAVNYIDAYYSLAISPPDGSQYFYLDNNDLSMMIGENGEVVWSRVDERFDQMLAPAFSKDGTMLLGGTYHGYFNFLKANNGTELDYFDAHDDWIRDIAISPDESKIATASDDETVKVWDFNTFELLFTLEGHTDYVRTVAFSPDGQYIASGGDDETVRIWDANTGASLHVLEGHENWVFAVAFTPDGSMLGSTGSDDFVLFWDPVTGNQIRKIKTSVSTKYSLEYTKDGKAFWAQDGREVKLYDIEDGTVLVTLSGHTGNIVRVRMSADGTTLVSAGYDGTIRVWRVK